MKESKVMIIGAGAAGLSCALYLKRAAIPFILLEKGAMGGKLLTIAKIENYPGSPELSGYDLAQSFIASAARFGVESVYGDVLSVSKQGSKFLVECQDESYLAEAVVVASGLSNVPSIKGEKEFLAKGVSYCATCDGPMFRHKEVMVYGEGEKALEEALYLAGLASKVYLLIPGAISEKGELEQEVLKKENLVVVSGSKVSEICGNNHVESVKYLQNGHENSLPVNAIFPLLGEKSASSFLSPLNVQMNHGFILVDKDMMSSVPGLFAAGDIVDKRLRQVVTAASDGAIASSALGSY